MFSPTIRLFACTLFATALVRAQPPRLDLKDLDPKEIKLGEDEPGCKDSALMPRLAGCNIIQCDVKEYDSLDLQVGAAADGAPQRENADGASEIVYYLCPGRLTPANIIKQSESGLVKSGFRAVFAGRDGDEFPLLTVKKDDQFIQISTYTYNNYSAYVLTGLKLAPEPPATAEAMIDELKARGRFPLAGLAFDGDKTDLPTDADKALAELVTALKSQPDVKIRVEVHTDNLEGPKTSQAITDKRAMVIMDWLAAQGIDKARMTGHGFGSEKPVADNDSEDGRAKNRRVEIVRVETATIARDGH
jgi:OmpA-OmpF porin, OOP family